MEQVIEKVYVSSSNRIISLSYTSRITLCHSALPSIDGPYVKLSTYTCQKSINSQNFNTLGQALP